MTADQQNNKQTDRQNSNIHDIIMSQFVEYSAFNKNIVTHIQPSKIQIREGYEKYVIFSQ